MNINLKYWLNEVFITKLRYTNLNRKGLKAESVYSKDLNISFSKLKNRVFEYGRKDKSDRRIYIVVFVQPESLGKHFPENAEVHER